MSTRKILVALRIRSPTCSFAPDSYLVASNHAAAHRGSKAAGLGRINPHRLRHISASRWLETGGSEGDAVALFGWADAT
jgi:integrase